MEERYSKLLDREMVRKTSVELESETKVCAAMEREQEAVCGERKA